MLSDFAQNHVIDNYFNRFLGYALFLKKFNLNLNMYSSIMYLANSVRMMKQYHRVALVLKIVLCKLS